MSNLSSTGEDSDEKGMSVSGWLERRGVEYVPPDQRSSRPSRIFVVFFGCSLSIMVAVYGGLMITLGLSLGAGLAAVLAGNLIGLLFTGPMILFGPRTGTNNQISSSAHFGTLGRLIGSGLSLVTTLIFAAVAIWSSGDALLALVSRVVGSDVANVGSSLVVYLVVTAGVVAIAIYGHHVIVYAYERLILPVGLAILALGFLAYAGSFTGDGASLERYALDGFWPTWALAVVIVASIPVSYTPMMGDYARYIPHTTSDRRLVAAAGGGLFLGNMLTMGFGAFVAYAVISSGASGFTSGLIEFSPVWYLPLTVVLIMTGAVGQGTMSMYSSGLDLESIVPILKRISASVITGIVSFALVIMGTVVLSAEASISAASTLLIVVTAPWALINIVGLYRSRGCYDALALQAFAHSDKVGNRYWFSAGWNVSATVSWVLASVAGLCASATSLYTGPLVPVFGGVDFSIFVAGVVATGMYLAMLRMRPGDRPGIVRSRNVDAQLQ